MSSKEGTQVNLGLWDTAGQGDYDRVRPLSYPDTSVFLLCFSLFDKKSFENAEIKWAPELKYHCPDTPIVLVGNKSDLSEETVQEISASDIKKLADRIGAAGYFECSAKTGEGLNNVFETSVEIALKARSKKKRKSLGEKILDLFSK